MSENGNGRACCILGICCPAGSLEQRVSLAHEIQKQRPNLDEDKALKAADKILRKFDNFSAVLAILDESAA
jgi:hypothetical protein